MYWFHILVVSCPCEIVVYIQSVFLNLTTALSSKQLKKRVPDGGVAVIPLHAGPPLCAFSACISALLLVAPELEKLIHLLQLPYRVCDGHLGIFQRTAGPLGPSPNEFIKLKPKSFVNAQP